MANNLQHYDTSAYSKTHPLYNPTNAKVIGKFKDETNSIPPQEFVGFRSKMYSLKCEYPKMTAKGIKKSYMKRHVRHSAFVDALRDKSRSTARFKTFKSINHVISTVDINKVCLSPFDCKRYILPDGISTLAYGHYSLRWTVTLYGCTYDCMQLVESDCCEHSLYDERIVVNMNFVFVCLWRSLRRIFWPARTCTYWHIWTLHERTLSRMDVQW